MITVVSTVQEEIPIHAFDKDGYPIYPARLDGHFIWDVPEAGMCKEGCPCMDDLSDEEEDVPRRRRQKVVKTPSTCKTYKPFPPDNPDSKSPLPIYQKGLKTLKKERLIPESQPALI